jgi:hypothetical protein
MRRSGSPSTMIQVACEFMLLLILTEFRALRLNAEHWEGGNNHARQQANTMRCEML